jgi:ERCC4-type nuclease
MGQSDIVNSNPIQLDDRTGSGDLLPLLRSRGLPTVLTRLPYGDAAFIGNGPDECPMPIGIEIKSISDILKCIGDGRFSGHQLPGLVADFDYIWLIAEGIYRSDQGTGFLQTYVRGGWRNAMVGTRRFMARELEQWFLTITIRAGVRIVCTGGRNETADFLRNLYNWWTVKSWTEHKSHLAPHLHSFTPDSALLVRPTLARLVAKELPGIGWEKSAAVAKTFPSVLEMAVAEEDDWRAIEGIGAKTAEKVVRAIRGSK